jgi:hypothetical protein
MDEPLELEGDLAAAALAKQDSAQSDDSWRGMIAEWLDKKVPEDWNRWDIEQRRMWWSDPSMRDPIPSVERQTVCIAEIWCEMMREDKSSLNSMTSRRIGNIIRSLGEWELIGPRLTAAYGNQKTYRRTTKDATE